MPNFREKLFSAGKPIIIGIAGDSGSGKTTYSNGIRRLIGIDMVQTITMDGYHRENRQQRKASGRLPLDPEVNNLELFFQHLKQLKNGMPIELPIYNHQSGDFGKPVTFTPGPIVIIEGLHALYPEFDDFYDFKIFVDPSRDVKWEWKYQRDVEARHHNKDELYQEMLARETAYKRWIDFQKTNANAIIKIKPSTLSEFARYESINKLPSECYRVELIMEPTSEKSESEIMHFDMPSLFTAEGEPFLIASVPSLYWGKKMSVIHIDGSIAESTISGLEKNIFQITNIPVEEMLKFMPKAMEHEALTGVQLAQLLIGWRFLEIVNSKL